MNRTTPRQRLTALMAVFLASALCHGQQPNSAAEGTSAEGLQTAKQNIVGNLINAPLENSAN